MTQTPPRFIKFCMVGAMGIAVQLAILNELHRVGVNYLLATFFGVESAVLHNFFWHQWFTWPDRESSGWLNRLTRFYVSNGLISLTGNLLITRLLVASGINLTMANALAIAVCAVLNFALSDYWVFTGNRYSRTVYDKP